ncbi:MAG TPA: hypothetical protein VK923_00720 [Euzebyales bacterium]|nr:hypothetical protein [Euzebyales bacterium]
MRLGCRIEYLFRADAARTGAEAAAGQDEQVDAFIHLYLLNRGIVMTPFHNMALMSPAPTAADVDRHTRWSRRSPRTWLAEAPDPIVETSRAARPDGAAEGMRSWVGAGPWEGDHAGRDRRGRTP